jgi:glutamine amidotransferase
MCADPEDATMESEYGYRFVCGVARGNVEGVQFHPEKSHLYGMTFLTNWLKHVNE